MFISKNKEDVRMMNNSFNPIHSGLKELDDVIGGFNPGEIVILVSTDPIERCAFALNVALKNALNNLPALILNSETSMEEAAKWALMSADNNQAIPKNCPLYIEEIGDSNIKELKERISKLKETSHIQIAVINPMNYAYQHLPDIKGKHISRIAEFICEMKELAKKLKILIILTARIIHDLDASPDEITLGNALADLLIGIDTFVDEYEENNKRIITVNKDRKNIAMFAVGFNRNYLRFYDLDKNNKPLVCKEVA
jgi:replicative DNA helicase